MKNVKAQIMEILAQIKLPRREDILERCLGEIRKEIRQETYRHPPQAARTTPEAVSKLFEKKREEEDELVVDQMAEGLGRVSFDLENFEYETDENTREQWGDLIGPRLFGELAGVGCYAGGDWEWPVFFVVYLDADGKTLRAYVPKAGNAWNYEKNSAFGNNDEHDQEFLKTWLRENRPGLALVKDRPLSPHDQDGDLMFDPEQILAEIRAKIPIATRTKRPRA